MQTVSSTIRSHNTSTLWIYLSMGNPVSLILAEFNIILSIRNQQFTVASEPRATK
jgi:hypothetical protein